ncbi:transcription elongation GreA/GreB family factor [Runella defluvii]|uniref:Transcription elongation GreA/GreB family factor n=1 Tax=Runella defluvii TaxID=370973 RepID=A0A7W5ZJ31_9BACT|nr:transcription elongation factor [Runella defluvii]MBB3838207.1 transcription elongation GreA/GreB family factor [Runella defluvii]
MKQQLLTLLKTQFDTRVQAAQEAMQNAQDSANEETKSSAGDKYETGRAMAQIERDRHAQLFDQLRQERAVLDRIDPDFVFQRVGLGALVTTSVGVFFVSVSAGMVVVEGQKVIAMSPQSPLGASLMGKQAGDSFLFQQKKGIIEGLT